MLDAVGLSIHPFIYCLWAPASQPAPKSNQDTTATYACAIEDLVGMRSNKRCGQNDHMRVVVLLVAVALGQQFE